MEDKGRVESKQDICARCRKFATLNLQDDKWLCRVCADKRTSRFPSLSRWWQNRRLIAKKKSKRE